MKNIYSQGWELCLEAQFLNENKYRRRAYICSPLRAEQNSEIMLNMRAARAYMFYAAVRLGFLARAPHAYLPMLLCDANKNERRLALEFGLELLHISEGMASEIVRAARAGLEIQVFHDKVYPDVVRIVRESGGDGQRVLLRREHSLLSLSSAGICMWAYAPADRLAREG